MADNRISRMPFEVKAAPDQGEGVFTGYASTWDKDLMDDVVVKGAYADCLAEDFGGTGKGIPIYWNHDYSSPMNLIGETLSAVEDEKGLAITGKLDIDSPEGKRAYEHLKSGRVHQMSIGYLAQETAWVKDEEAKYSWEGHRELRKVKLFEVSLVTVAANQAAEVTGVKASGPEFKKGRAISAANEEKIRAAHGALGEILQAIDGDPEGEPGEADEKSAIRAGRAAEFKKIAEEIGGATTSKQED